MASVFDVAKYVLKKQGPMSTWKLQKLCYYSQAWSLAWDGEPLFSEDFEAWKNGPVCRPLYACHRGRYHISADDLPCGDEADVDENGKENIDIVLDFYGEKEPHWLRAQTHSEEPWLEARGNLPEDALCATVISKESMGLFYGGL